MTISRRGLIVAAGGLGAARPDQHYEPPAGGQAITGARGVVRARQVIIIGGTPPGAGLYVYNPTLAAGNLIASIASNSGTDSVGDAVIQGIANYVNTGSNYQAIVLQNGQLVLYQAATEAGPWSLAGEVNINSSNGITFEATGVPGHVVLTSLNGDVIMDVPGVTAAFILSSANLELIVPILEQAASAGVNIFSGQVNGDTVPRLAIDSNGTMTWGTGSAAADTTLSRLGGVGLNVNIGTNNAIALAVANTGTNGGKPLMQLTTSVAADRALGIEAAADTSERIRIDSVPQILMGSGTAAPDCTFSRAGPQEFFSDGIAAKISGAAEVWNAATFLNGWANAATGPALQYRLVAAPYNSVQWVGRIVAPAGVVAGQTVTNAPVAAYHPAHFGDIIAWDATANTPQLFRIGTGGALLYQAGTIVAADVITIPVTLVSLDA